MTVFYVMLQLNGATLQSKTIRANICAHSTYTLCFIGLLGIWKKGFDICWAEGKSAIS